MSLKQIETSYSPKELERLISLFKERNVKSLFFYDAKSVAQLKKALKLPIHSYKNLPGIYVITYYSIHPPIPRYSGFVQSFIDFANSNEKTLLKKLIPDNYGYPLFLEDYSHIFSSMTKLTEEESFYVAKLFAKGSFKKLNYYLNILYDSLIELNYSKDEVDALYNVLHKNRPHGWYKWLWEIPVEADLLYNYYLMTEEQDAREKVMNKFGIYIVDEEMELFQQEENSNLDINLYNKMINAYKNAETPLKKHFDVMQYSFDNDGKFVGDVKYIFVKEDLEFWSMFIS
ncbi:MAG: hypothetical protein ACOCW8_00455, partial [bacterium]